MLGKLQGLEDVVEAVRGSVEEVQTQAVSDHDIHVGMCQQLQRLVDDLMQRDSGSDGGGVSRSQRADAKDENAAWLTDAIRRFWILTAERPVMFNLKRSELQAVLAEVTAVTDRVTNQLNTLTGFSLTDSMTEGDDTSSVGDMFLPEQMDVMGQSLLTVIGTGVGSDTGVERMQTLASAFHEGADTLRVHCRKHRGKLRISGNINIMRDLVNEDVKSWAADLFGAAVDALKASRSPPTDFSDVVGPTWTKINGYITTEGLQHAPNVTASGLKKSGVKRAAPAGAVGPRGPCWAGSKPDGCSFGKACACSYSPAKKYRRAMAAAAVAVTAAVEVAAPFPAVGATAAAAATAVVAALRVRVPGPGVACVFQPLPRLLPVLDEDAGSVGRRGQPWSPRGAYPRRQFIRGNGRGRRCNLSQEQILGEAG